MKNAGLLISLVVLGATSAFALKDPVGTPAPEVSQPKSAVESSTSSVDVVYSTTPLGSPYYRHLAQDFNIDIKELVKFERKGFGRQEIVMLIIIANTLEKPLKEIGNRRIKEKVPMDVLVKEAKLNYGELVSAARDVKEDIESRGLKDLPKAVYDVANSTPGVVASPAPKKKKENKPKEEVKP